MREQPLCEALAGKVREHVELIEGLIGKLPEGHPGWKASADDKWSTARLLGHLLDCMAGMCAVLYAAKPEALGHFGRLRGLRVNHECGPEEARERIREYAGSIAEGFSVLTDADLARAIPTVFVPAGEPLLTLILGNLEHIGNHKHELFVRLKRMGVDVGTRDLYRFRE
jgi:hypothetical protein